MKMKYVSLISLVVFLLLPAVSFALELTYPEFGGIKITNGTSINELVAWLYYGIIAIAGLASFFIMVSGGFQYLTSAGNPSSMGEAKDKIMNAVLGLILIFASYIILKAINPDLVFLKLPTL
ncbi:MAG: hypothetical protein HYW70_00045 [Candidatus Nealsonbacteria bacterium]|nr:hypothetical protein [Candidatus Nealsonbacteria bacterium]